MQGNNWNYPPEPDRMLSGQGINAGNEGIMTSGQGQGIMPLQQPPEGAQQYCLRWNSYPATVATQLAQLRQGEDFVDVTLACDGQQLRAHKIVLSACSPYFMQLFKSTPCHHPVVFLRDVRFSQLRALLEFMYAGEVNVSQAELPALLRTAEALQVRGLADTTNNNFGAQLPVPPQKPIFTQHQQYIPIPTTPVMSHPVPTLPQQIPSPNTLPHQQPPQNPPMLMSMETVDENPGMPLDNVTHPQPTTSQQQQLLLHISSKTQDNGSTLQSADVENESSSKENLIDIDSSDSNDSQDDYVAGFQFDEKSKLLQNQPISIPVHCATPASALNTPDGARNMSDGGPDSWNLATLGAISLGGIHSEVEMSDEDENEEGEEDDDGEFNVKVTLPPLSSETSSDNTQESGGGEEAKVNPNGENVPGPSMTSTSFPFPPTPDSDKSKDLKPENPGNLPPRNRFSRALWPPGVPYHGPQQCPYCPRVLSNVGNWRKHVLTMHFAREKNFKCCHCNSSFRTSEYLQKHYVRVHSYAPKMSRKKGLLGSGPSSSPTPPNSSGHPTPPSNLLTNHMNA